MSLAKKSRRVFSSTSVLLTEHCTDEALKAAGCWSWRAGADAIIIDFKKACREAAEKYPYIRPSLLSLPSAQSATAVRGGGRERTEEEEAFAADPNAMEGGGDNTATNNNSLASYPSTANTSMLSAASPYIFPSALTDNSNRIGSYAKVYALCRSPKRCNGVGVVDYLLERLEEAFEQWVSANIAAVGLKAADDEEEDGHGNDGNARVDGANSTAPSPPSSSFRSPLLFFQDFGMLARRYFFIKKSCRLQFLYVDHNSKDAVQILLRKCLRNHIQNADNEAVLSNLIGAEFREWVDIVIEGGGDFSLTHRKDEEGEGSSNAANVNALVGEEEAAASSPSSQQRNPPPLLPPIDPHAPSDVIAFLDDLSMHRIANRFCRDVGQGIARAFGEQLASLVVNAPVMMAGGGEGGDEGREEEGSAGPAAPSSPSPLSSTEAALEASTARLVHLHDTLRRGEAIVVGFLGLGDTSTAGAAGGGAHNPNNASVATDAGGLSSNSLTSASAAAGGIPVGGGGQHQSSPSHGLSAREQSLQRVHICLSALFDGAAKTPQIMSLIQHCSGLLFISAAMLGNEGAYRALEELVRGLCAAHGSFVDAICSQIEVYLFEHLQKVTAIHHPNNGINTNTNTAAEGGAAEEDADAYYFRFYNALCDALVRSFNFFFAMEVPHDSNFFSTITLVFKRFIDSKEAICVPAFALALHRLVRIPPPPNNNTNMANPPPPPPLIEISEGTMDSLTRLVSFLGPKDLFIEAFSQSLAADSLMLSVLGGGTATPLFVGSNATKNKDTAVEWGNAFSSSPPQAPHQRQHSLSSLNGDAAPSSFSQQQRSSSFIQIGDLAPSNVGDLATNVNGIVGGVVEGIRHSRAGSLLRSRTQSVSSVASQKQRAADDAVAAAATQLIQQQQQDHARLHSTLPPLLLQQWARYQDALLILSRSISPTLCSTPLAMLNDLRTAGRDLSGVGIPYNNHHQHHHRDGNGSIVAGRNDADAEEALAFLPKGFEATLATLCIARWRPFCFPLLVPTVAQMGDVAVTGGGSGSNSIAHNHHHHQAVVATAKARSGGDDGHDDADGRRRPSSLSPLLSPIDTANHHSLHEGINYLHHPHHHSQQQQHRFLYGTIGKQLSVAASVLARTDTRVLTWVLHAGSVVVEARFPLLAYPILLTLTPCYALVLSVAEDLLREAANEARFGTPTSPLIAPLLSCGATNNAENTIGSDSSSFSSSTTPSVVANAAAIPPALVTSPPPAAVSIAKEAVVGACPWLPPSLVRRFIGAMTRLGVFETVRSPNSFSNGNGNGGAARSHIDPMMMATANASLSHHHHSLPHMRIADAYKGPRKIRLLLHTEELAAAVAAATTIVHPSGAGGGGDGGGAYPPSAAPTGTSTTSSSSARPPATTTKVVAQHPPLCSITGGGDGGEGFNHNGDGVAGQASARSSSIGSDDDDGDMCAGGAANGIAKEKKEKDTADNSAAAFVPISGVGEGEGEHEDECAATPTFPMPLPSSAFPSTSSKSTNNNTTNKSRNNQQPFGALTSMSSTFGDRVFTNAMLPTGAAGGGFEALKNIAAGGGGGGGDGASAAGADDSSDVGGGMGRQTSSGMMMMYQRRHASDLLLVPPPPSSSAASDVAANSNTINTNHAISADNARTMLFRMKTMEAFIVRIMKNAHVMRHDDLLESAMTEISRVGPLTVVQFKQCIQELISRDYLRRGEAEGTYEYVA